MRVQSSTKLRKQRAVIKQMQPLHHLLQSRVVHGELLKMNSENAAALERHFEGWLSVILGRGNWKVLGGFP